MTVWDRYAPASDLVFRVLFSLIFVIAGVGHFAQSERMLERLIAAPGAGLATAVAPAPLLIAVTGVLLITGGVALLLGVATRWAAVSLIVALLPITVSVHVGPGADHVGPLFKNVALLGGLVHFAVRGPGAYSLAARHANG